MVAKGEVLVGTNNEGRRNPKLGNDRGVVMAFDAKDGKFLWQSTHEKLPETKVHDWPLQGVCSSPAIEGNRVYYISNRGPGGGASTSRASATAKTTAPTRTKRRPAKADADIVWIFDMMADADVFPHNMAASSPLVIGDLVYVTTGNGVDEGHANIPSPLAPSFLALNKKTGELVWEDASASRNILHGTWSNPSYGVIGGRPPADRAQAATAGSIRSIR